MPLHREDINIINVFSIENKGGNPCAVVDNADHLSTKEMQALATRLNLPETVYILRNKQQILLRFFATKKEHPLCYHGALGAAFYLYKLHGFKEIYLSSYLELTSMKMRCEDNVASISIPNRSKVVKAPIDVKNISKLLRISQYYIDKNLPCLVASVGNSKLFVPIIDRTSLFNINPNLKLISEWCRDNNINGIYAYSADTEHSDSDYVGRNFNPLFSHQEDIATGTAAAALCQMITLSAPLLNYTFTIEQGANLNSPSKIAVLVTEDALEIKGHAYFPKKITTIIRGKLMPKPLPNIKLRGHLQRSLGKCSSLVSIISIDQHYQQDDEFKAFCLAMNEEYEKKNLLKLTIVETGYLKRHYLRLDKSYSSIEEADLSAIQLGKNWVQEQSSSLNLLKVPIEIISWKVLLEEQASPNDKPFSEYLDIVKDTYKTDEVFAREVDALSKKYGEKLSGKYNPHKDETLDKACIEAAKSYLLEESSIIFKLVPRGFNAQIYPGNRNAALRYIYKKFFKETNPMPWIRYDIKYPSNSEGKKLNLSSSLFFESSNDSTQSDVEKKSEETVRISL